MAKQGDGGNGMTEITKDELAQKICDDCIANDWYCPSECDFLEKMRRVPIKKLNERYEHYQGYIYDFARWLKRTKY